MRAEGINRGGFMERRTLLVGAVLGTPLAWAGGIDRLRWLSEAKIDIGLAALTLAQEFSPALDVAAYSRKLDGLAAAVLSRLRGSTDPVERTLAMREVLFREGGFHYDHHPSARTNQQNYLLDGLLDTKKGMCVTMPLMYVAVAQRLDYPVHAVCVPDHMFVRYVHRDFPELNVETTSGGKYFTDADYIRRFGVNQTAIRAGSYMRPLSYREHLGQMITTNAFIYALNRNAPRCLEYLKTSLLLNPRRAETYEQLSAIYDGYRKVTTGSESARYAEQSKEMMKKALQLGYVAIEDVQKTRELRGQ